MQGNIHKKCDGCKHVEGTVCDAYVKPEVKWRIGNCPLASHITNTITSNVKVRVGQQKQRKSR